MLAPFLIMGCYRAYSKEHIGENEAMFRDLQRSGTFLIRNARVFVGDGTVMENASVLVHDGKIVDVFDGAGPDPGKIRADVVEGAGKTLLPGLIDVHVHLSSPGGISTSTEDYDLEKSMPRAAAALLYSGVTAARSMGDGLDSSLKLRGQIADGSKLGRAALRLRPHVHHRGRARHGVHAVRPGGDAGQREGATGAHSQDGRRSAQAGARSESRAAWTASRRFWKRDWATACSTTAWTCCCFARWPRKRTRRICRWRCTPAMPAMSPTRWTLAPVRWSTDRGATTSPTPCCKRWRGTVSIWTRPRRWPKPTRNTSAARPTRWIIRWCSRLLPATMLKGTRDFVTSGKAVDPAKAAIFEKALEQSRENLLRAWKAGVPLVMGTDSGNPLVFPGPSLHRELQLWVQAGIPPAVALQAATGNAAKLLGAAGRIGGIRKGMDADLLLVDGNPLQDISATERISVVVFKGEKIQRADLFEQK